MPHAKDVCAGAMHGFQMQIVMREHAGVCVRQTALHMKLVSTRWCVSGQQPLVLGCAQRAIYGNFSGPKAQEIIVSRGKVLELLRPDESGKMQTIVATEVF